MGITFSMNEGGGKRTAYRIPVGKPAVKRTLRLECCFVDVRETG